MKYLELANTYQELENNPSRLKKIEILSEFLKKLKKSKDKHYIYLLEGKVFPDYSEKEFGISERLCIKALSKSTGATEKELINLWKKLGDLGLVAESVTKNKKQGTLFSHELTIQKVFDNLHRLPSLVGKGTIDKKMSLIAELLTSSSGIEAKYIIRTLLNQLRIGVKDGTIRDAIVDACFTELIKKPEKEKSKEKNKELDHIKEKHKELKELVEKAYNKVNDFALVFESACEGIPSLRKIKLIPGRPIKTMLANKAESISDGFDKVGKPAVFEYKYDGFRMLINKDKSGNISIFTRRLDEVTKQFPEVVEYIKTHVKADTFILDSEAIGYDPKTKKYTPFEKISQRIRRKHNIEKLIKELPIEVNVFDIIYLNGKSLLDTKFKERSIILRKLIKPHKYKIRCAHQLITDDEKLAEKFYKEALKDNQEGVMIKNLNAIYHPGTRVGHMLKLKPVENELDLVITGAEYGKGKRVGTFSSFILSALDPKTKEFLEIGKASTGLKEKSELGLSYEELTKLLKPLVKSEKGRILEIKPKIIVEIIYQNIQRSPTYKSGFALRFPRIIKIRHDKHLSEVSDLKEIASMYNHHELKIHY